MAGVQQIPSSLYDAARVDGAGAVREFFAVTLPALRNVIAVALTLTLVVALRTFDLVYVMTKGGPGAETTVPGLLIYQAAFLEGRVGYASALALSLGVLILILSLGIIRTADSRAT
jgi:raffinose/stachyose/melibiose transport system permease protein